MDFLHANAGRLRPRLQQPGRLHASHKTFEVVVIQDVNKFRDEEARFPGPAAHGKFVAEITQSREAHARDAQAFAEGSYVFHVEFVEGHDAVDRMRTSHEADGANDVRGRKIFRHIKHFVDGFARPICVAKFFYGEKKDAAARVFCRAQEFLAFFIRTDAENG